MPAAGERSAAAEDTNEPVRPLALPSPSVHPANDDVEEVAAAATEWRAAQYVRRRRRCVLCCGGCCVTTVVILGIVILVLALTVFKVKDPVLTMNGVSLAAFNTGAGATATALMAVNLTLTADLSIKNPNVASFRFSRSETDLYYKGDTVAVAYAPEGKVGADRTVRVNVTLDVLTDRLAPKVNITGLLFGQEYSFTSHTEISGRVSVLGIYKRNLHIKMNCSIALDARGLANAGVQSKGTDCVAKVS